MSRACLMSASFELNAMAEIAQRADVNDYLCDIHLILVIKNCLLYKVSNAMITLPTGNDLSM